MKNLFLTTTVLLLVTNLVAQNCKLSPEANRYWIRATTAMNTITSDDDYKIAAEEFEKALQYAPQCGDILYNLALIYSQIGTKEGNFYFSKAENYLETYKQLNPNDEEVEKLAVEIEFKREKYQKDKQKDKIREEKERRERELEEFAGTWEIEHGGKEISIEVNNGKISITVASDNRGSKKTVEGYVLNGFLEFEVNTVYYCNSGEYDSATKRRTYREDPCFDSYGTYEYKLSIPKNGCMSVSLLLGKSNNYRSGTYIGTSDAYGPIKYNYKKVY